MTKTYLKFLKDIISDDRLVKYFSGQKYEIKEMRDDIYVLKKYDPPIILADGNTVEIDGIEKGLDGNVYEVIEIEVD